MKLIKQEMIDNSFERVYLNGIPPSQFADVRNHPTHFTMTKREEGELKGYDKVRYYRKISEK